MRLPLARRIPSRIAYAGAVVASLLLATAASAGMLEDRLAQTESQAEEVKGQIAEVDQAQQELVRKISAQNELIRELDAPIGELTVEIGRLDGRISTNRGRIAELSAEFEEQRREIVRLGIELESARTLLAQRLVEAYKHSNDDVARALSGAKSITEAWERRDAIEQVVGLDEEVIASIAETERIIRVKRSRNLRLREEIAAANRELDADRATAEARRAEVERRQEQLEQAKAVRDEAMASLNERESDLRAQHDDLQDEAAELEKAIEQGAITYQGRISGGPSPAGLVWPVSGPVVSPFGPRWGRLHAGIDIAVGAGTPIIAAAGGVVTHAGWMDGYGNLVLVQHGGGLVTAYAHQSQIAVGVGSYVSQGQVVGYVGCTGHCYGDHLHFETRVNGAPQDPMGYL